jgi:hypothetical protein
MHLTNYLKPFHFTLITMIVISLLTHSISRVYAQSNADTSQPDIQAIVMKGPGGSDMVNITYPKVISASQAARDVAALAQNCNLGSVNVDVSNQSETLKTIKTQPMTSATFAAKGMMPDENHETAFHLEPWVESLKNYHVITITYMLNKDFGFNGLRQYHDNNVAIALDRQGNAYTYRIVVLNPNFTHIKLPFLQSDADKATYARIPPTKKPWYIAAILAIGAIAAGCGYGVWAILTKIG